MEKVNDKIDCPEKKQKFFRGSNFLTQKGHDVGNSPERLEQILIKPHHFIDIITSFGAGKRIFHPHEYGHAMHVLSAQILDNPDISLTLELGIDDICKPCSHNVCGVCNDTIDVSYRPAAPSLKNEWNLLIDKRWCTRLGVTQGDRFTAYTLCKRISDKMGDITDIYREIPSSMTAERNKNLLCGLNFYLRN